MGGHFLYSHDTPHEFVFLDRESMGTHARMARIRAIWMEYLALRPLYRGGALDRRVDCLVGRKNSYHSDTRTVRMN